MAVNQTSLIDAVGLIVAYSISDVVPYSPPLAIPRLVLPPLLDYTLEEKRPQCHETDISNKCPPGHEIHAIVWISLEVDTLRFASIYVNDLEEISLQVWASQGLQTEAYVYHTLVLWAMSNQGLN